MIHSRKGRWAARVTNTGLCVSCEQAGLDLHYEIRELDVIWIWGWNMEEYGVVDGGGGLVWRPSQKNWTHADTKISWRKQAHWDTKL